MGEDLGTKEIWVGPWRTWRDGRDNQRLQAGWQCVYAGLGMEWSRLCVLVERVHGGEERKVRDRWAKRIHWALNLDRWDGTRLSRASTWDFFHVFILPRLLFSARKEGEGRKERRMDRSWGSFLRMMIFSVLCQRLWVSVSATPRPSFFLLPGNMALQRGRWEALESSLNSRLGPSYLTSQLTWAFWLVWMSLCILTGKWKGRRRSDFKALYFYIPTMNTGTLKDSSWQWTYC